MVKLNTYMCLEFLLTKKLLNGAQEPKPAVRKKIKSQQYGYDVEVPYLDSSLARVQLCRQKQSVWKSFQVAQHSTLP